MSNALDTTKKRGAGRPKAKIDPDHVVALAKAGCTVDEMAAFLKVNKKTLERRFGKVIDEGRLTRNVSLRRKQIELAMKGDRTMLIWLGKQLLGQSDKTQLTGKDGGPIETKAVEQMTDEQLDSEIRDILGPVASAGANFAGEPGTA